VAKVIIGNLVLHHKDETDLTLHQKVHEEKLPNKRLQGNDLYEESMILEDSRVIFRPHSIWGCQNVEQAAEEDLHPSKDACDKQEIFIFYRLCRETASDPAYDFLFLMVNLWRRCLKGLLHVLRSGKSKFSGFWRLVATFDVRV